MLVAVWLLVALPAAVALFLNGSRTIVLAGHDAVVRPSLDGWATVDLGPYLPNVRYPSHSKIGAHIDLGKTTSGSYAVIIQRYAFLASQPQAQIRKVARQPGRPGRGQRCRRRAARDWRARPSCSSSAGGAGPSCAGCRAG